LSDDIDSRAVWDNVLAQDMLGKVILVGLTFLSVDGKIIEQQQFYGSVLSAHPRRGILLSLGGRRSGEQYNLPPDTRSIAIASPGEYRLRATDEIVGDPDYTIMFSVSKQA
jgi:hypothetical protein